ncbi:hypothetical protein H5410_027800, partial [Solanum commersonii]
MNIHNKTQITPAKINCVLKDSSCDTITKDSHARNTSYLCKFKINKKNQMQHSHSKGGTQYMFSPIGFPFFSNRSPVRLTQDKK